MQKVVLLGDSIRKGYQPTVIAALLGRAAVSGPDENCSNSGILLAGLEAWAIAPQPAIVHVNCGLHDIKRAFDSDDCAVPLDAYRDNVCRILETLQARTEAEIIWATTTPVDRELHHRVKPFDRVEKDVAAYNAAALQVARERGVLVNDLYAVATGLGPMKAMSPDGVHFSPEGYTALGKAVAACIEKVLPLSSGTRVG